MKKRPSDNIFISSPVRLEQARLVSSLSYGTLGHVCFKFAGFRNKFPVYDRFRGNGLYGEILAKKEPIRTLGFTSKTTLPYNDLLNQLVRSVLENIVLVLSFLYGPHPRPGSYICKKELGQYSSNTDLTLVQ